MAGFGQYQDLLISKLSALTDPESSETLMSACTNKDDHTTATRVLCDSDGKLMVSMSGGGDATASNQVLINDSLTNIHNELQTPSSMASELTLQNVESGITSLEGVITTMDAKLPTALSANGNLQVSIEEGGVEANQLPTALSANGNLKVSLEEGVSTLSTSALQTVGNANINTMSAKLPSVLVGDRLKVVNEQVYNDAVGSIVMSVPASTSSDVSFSTEGYRTVNIYGGIAVGSMINSGSGYGVHCYVENSPNNTDWYYYKELYINSGMNNENNIANVEVVIAPYMRVVVQNDDSVAYQCNVYVHGIKSSD